jgi:hypothetical protein
MGERRGVYRVLVGKPEGKRPPGRPRLIWENNVKMDLQEVEWKGMDKIDLAQNRDSWAGSFENSNEASGSIK